MAIADRTRKPLTGKRFGRWTVLGRDVARGPNYWSCLCDCGTKKSLWRSALTSGLSSSCGCSKRTHPLVGTPTHKSWRSMLGRCRNPNDPSYGHYGGRGITVCERWRHSFANFVTDMGVRPKGTSIDRIDNDGDYCQENCRWADEKTQKRNQRTTQMVVYRGERMPLITLAEAHGFNRYLLRARLARGWSIEDAVNTPVDKTKWPKQQP